MAKKQKILIIKLGAIGDVVFAMPALNAIKSILPESHISWVVGQSCLPLLKSHSLLDDLIVVDDSKFFSKNPAERLIEAFRLRNRLKGDKSLILVGHRALSYTLLLKSKYRCPIFQLARHEPLWWKKKLQRSIVIKPVSTHESLAMKELVKCGLEHLSSQKLDNLPWERNFSNIPNCELDLPSSFLVLHIGGAVNSKTEFRLKRWPHFTELIFRLLKETNKYLVLVGNHLDLNETGNILKEVHRKFFNNITSHSSVFPEYRLVNRVGQTNLVQLINLLKRASIFVGVDSGPLHIADSLNIPSIGLYGPTSPVSWGLIGNNSIVLRENLECSPCYKDDGYFLQCQFKHKCMKDLNAEVVLREILCR
tara:strand:- start:1409 stop:2503 length:1095 start_codon:yes stop_codon:yes gene_type:complete